MGDVRLQVFLASRFDEFKQLRHAVRTGLEQLAWPLQVIDLNDGRADDRPVLERCRVKIRQSEFVVVLVGDEYGEPIPGLGRSFVHVEYREAMKSNKMVFPFFIGRAPNQSTTSEERISDSKLARLQAEVRKEHTVPFYSVETSPEEIAAVIVESFRGRLSELFVPLVGDKTQRDNEALEEDDARSVDHAMLSILEPEKLAHSEATGSGDSHDSRVIALMSRPAETAAAEQAVYALRAMRIAQPGVAILHLRRALEIRPCHVERTYWLAHLLVATGTTKRCLEAVSLAQTAARIARAEGQELTAAACLVVAARGLRRAGDDGIDLAAEAHELAGWHWVTSYELGCQHATREAPESTDAALACIEKAFRLRPDTLLLADQEPAFQALGQSYKAFRTSLRDSVRAEVERILSVEGRILQTAAGDATQLDSARESLSNARILRLVRAARASVRRQLEQLRSVAQTLRRDATQFAGDVAEEARTKDKLRWLKDQARTLDEQRLNVQRGGALLAAAAACVLAASLWIARAGLGNVVIGIGILTIMALFASVVAGFARWSKLRDGIADNMREQTQCRTRITRIEAVRVELGHRTHALAELVGSYEAVALVAAYHPAVPLRRARSGDAVRLETEGGIRGLNVDRTFVCPELACAGVQVADPPGRFQLFRLVTAGERPNLSRWAAYFE